ncbi:hypothetical protein Q8F55_000253 [Vanrija albida]|uniref:Tyrosine specific protein phosphatases domain-containing protein n=1 Tax=Vanrija albida TaxID=181172 RepID=A0ABR3QDD0_9TREE
MAHKQHVRRVWDVLQERERVRMSRARQASSSRYVPPEAVVFTLEESRHARDDNRYSDVLAYDRTSVRVDGRHYLNASVVSDPSGNWWVAAQAPLPHTFYPFFRAIYARSASNAVGKSQAPRRREAILVQLTGWRERGVRKADPYLPRSTGDDVVFYRDTSKREGVRLRLAEQKRQPELGSVYSALRLTREVAEANGGATAASDAEDMLVHHFYFDSWPDHGVPDGESLDALQNLIRRVASLRDEHGGDEVHGQDVVETWVHCSAGVGRTGTFLALASLCFSPHSQAPLAPLVGPLPRDLAHDPIAQTIDIMRDSRGKLVQTPDQLELVYSLASVMGSNA